MGWKSGTFLYTILQKPKAESTQFDLRKGENTPAKSVCDCLFKILYLNCIWNSNRVNALCLFRVENVLRLVYISELKLVKNFPMQDYRSFPPITLRTPHQHDRFRKSRKIQQSIL